MSSYKYSLIKNKIKDYPNCKDYKYDYKHRRCETRIESEEHKY